MKIIIDISEDVYTRLFDNGIQDNEIAVDDVCEMARALRIGTPLDDVKAEIEEMRIKFMEQGGVYEHSAYGLDYAIALLDDIGKAESEEE